MRGEEETNNRKTERKRLLIHFMEATGCFEVVDGQWVKVEVAEAGEVEEERVVNVVTLNVMFSHWRGKEYHHAWTLPRERYEFILDELLQMDADVVALNEVTPMFVEQLRRHKVGQKYFVGGLEVLGEGGNVCLSTKRWPPPQCVWVALPRLPRAAVGMQLAGLTLCAAHLSALSSNGQRRATQLHALAAAMHKTEKTKRHTNGGRERALVICGDLNFHSAAEDASIPGGWADAPYAGHSWDAARNPLHAVLWPLGYEERQMRLDRVLARRCRIASCRLVFDALVYRNKDKKEKEEQKDNNNDNNNNSNNDNNDNDNNDNEWEAPSLVRRALWQCGFAQPPPSSYLMPSDHFGLAFQVLLYPSPKL